jgi:hypothetical protein
MCRLFYILAISLFLQACESKNLKPHREVFNDSHFHITNYVYQGASLKYLIDKYMGDRIQRSTVMPIPLQQKWDLFENYADGEIPPNYYLGPKAELYYYAFADAMIAKEYQELDEQDKARIDPMITGFNPMDNYAPQHIKRVLLTFPGVYSGIGEFSIHKEVVSKKIAGDPIGYITKTMIPPDVTKGEKLTLYSKALDNLLDLVAETGLVAVMHNDIYNTDIKYDASIIKKSPAENYTKALKHLCKVSPKATVIWAHTGMGRFVHPSPNHLKLVADVMDKCPNWYTDISWDLVQEQIVKPTKGMPSVNEWAKFVTKYQDRILWGSDAVIYTKNKIEDNGKTVLGTLMPKKEYEELPEILRPLWDRISPEVFSKIRYENHVRLFDNAREKVRQWEEKNKDVNVWDLPAD